MKKQLWILSVLLLNVYSMRAVIKTDQELTNTQFRAFQLRGQILGAREPQKTRLTQELQLLEDDIKQYRTWKDITNRLNELKSSLASDQGLINIPLTRKNLSDITELIVQWKPTEGFTKSVNDFLAQAQQINKTIESIEQSQRLAVAPYRQPALLIAPSSTIDISPFIQQATPVIPDWMRSVVDYSREIASQEQEIKQLIGDRNASLKIQEDLKNLQKQPVQSPGLEQRIVKLDPIIEQTNIDTEEAKKNLLMLQIEQSIKNPDFLKNADLFMKQLEQTTKNIEQLKSKQLIPYEQPASQQLVLNASDIASIQQSIKKALEATAIDPAIFNLIPNFQSHVDQYYDRAVIRSNIDLFRSYINIIRAIYEKLSADKKKAAYSAFNKAYANTFKQGQESPAQELPFATWQELDEYMKATYNVNFNPTIYARYRHIIEDAQKGLWNRVIAMLKKFNQYYSTVTGEPSKDIPFKKKTAPGHPTGQPASYPTGQPALKLQAASPSMALQNSINALMALREAYQNANTIFLRRQRDTAFRQELGKIVTDNKKEMKNIAERINKLSK